MIKAFLWVVFFLVLVALAPILIGEKGYVLVAMGNTTYETTVVYAAIMLIFVLLLFLIVLRLLRHGLTLSFGAWNKVVFAGQRRARRDFNKGVAAYILQDNVNAEHLLVRSAEKSQFEQSAYLMAADAAQKQNERTNAKHYVEQVQKMRDSLKVTGLDAIIVQAKLLINADALEEARALLDEHHKQLGHDYRLLTQEIDLCLIEKRYQTAVSHIALARKQKEISDNTLQHWEKVAYYGAFEEILIQQDKNALVNFFSTLPRKVKNREMMVLSYCQILAKHKISDQLTDVLLPIVKSDASDRFLQQIVTLPNASAEPLMQVVQKHLSKDPKSTKWLRCMGHLALATEQWDTAEKAFNSIFNQSDVKPLSQDYDAIAKALAQQNRHAEAYNALAAKK
ncbi:heme biosynthesis HemY N-terminal domain-containing protein [Thalassotalea agarivorans]|uniref:HemY protein n=1 Tax=Thalassotalea agarivorans TaxID=349064 RepID=A0A1I0CJL9_THASX|nr:heme biosynthesis HemY N-terminal domain-containing protein [Thalassotalea agarivorans]SET19169.1 HemY protein [Thalassotalea agarivorans]